MALRQKAALNAFGITFVGRLSARDASNNRERTTPSLSWPTLG
jgi:hypothetical protein